MRHERTILLAVSGTSPAIITETVWALAGETPQIIPDEILVITTSRGAQDIQSQLLTPRPDWGGLCVWTSLRRSILGSDAENDFRLQLAAPRVIEVPDPVSGIKKPTSDLRTPNDNSATADYLLEEVRRLSENPDIRVIASIAGGRKTMGALLYAAMTLLGRENDRITHVLVSEPFERCRDFFFPTQPLKRVTAFPSQEEINATKAKIQLADIPFAPLRNLFERDFTRRPGSFSSLVNTASRKISLRPPVKVEVATHEPIVKIDHTAVRFTPREHVLNILLARHCMEGHPPFPDHSKTHEAYQRLADELRGGADAFSWKADIPPQVESEDIRKILSGIRRKLKGAGKAGADFQLFLSSRNPAFTCDPAVFQIR